MNLFFITARKCDARVCVPTSTFSYSRRTWAIPNEYFPRWNCFQFVFLFHDWVSINGCFFVLRNSFRFRSHWIAWNRSVSRRKKRKMNWIEMTDCKRRHCGCFAHICTDFCAALFSSIQLFFFLNTFIVSNRLDWN